MMKIDDTLLKDDEEDLLIYKPCHHEKEEVKEEKGIKILTPNKLLTRLPVLLAQIKARNDSYKLKNKTRQIVYLLYQHNKIIKKISQQFNQVIIIIGCNKIVLITEPKTIRLDFHKGFGNNVKHKIESPLSL